MSDRETDGRFAKGNRIWEARSTAGPKPIFATPEPLWDACIEYFEWVESNPFMEAAPVTFQGQGSTFDVPRIRPMTIDGLCVFLDIARSTWDNWKNNRADLLEVVTRAEAVIREQKLTGAMAGFFNANIVARDLGLRDATVNEHTGKDGGPIQTIDTSKLSETAMAEILTATDAAKSG